MADCLDRQIIRRDAANTEPRGSANSARSLVERGGAPLALVAAMTITLTGLLILLVVAGICGAIGRAIAGGTRGGFFVSIAVGFVGALLGTYIAHAARLPELLVVAVDRHPFPILWSIIGASLFVAIVHLLSGAPVRRYYP